MNVLKVTRGYICIPITLQHKNCCDNKAIQNYPKLSKTIKNYQKLSKTIKTYQKLSKTTKNYQKL